MFDIDNSIDHNKFARVFQGPLIYERDLYLAWTLKRSRAVCGQRRVVGVVGRGHLAGVMRAVEADRGGDTLVSGGEMLRVVLLRIFPLTKFCCLSVLCSSPRK